MEPNKIPKIRRLIWGAFVTVTALATGVCLGAGAQALAILHSFNDGTVADDGENPDCSLTRGVDGNYYGTTWFGGSSGHGTVFRMSTSGLVAILHSFPDGGITNDGQEPAGPLDVGPDGDLYGVTEYGGATGYGTAFKVSLSGSYTLLASFGASVGEYPTALVTGTDGYLYGAAGLGGTANQGTLFRLSTTGDVTVLHSFGDGTVIRDGLEPSGPLTLGTDGNLYGTTWYGGASEQVPSQLAGTIYRSSTTGAVTILHAFADGSVRNDGSEPSGGLVQASDGNLYGLTSIGGSVNYGTAFRMTPTGAVTILHSFNDGTVENDGASPVQLILGIDGALYGVTEGGGVSPGDGGYGTMFRLTTSGQIAILHSFGDGSVANDGQYPVGITQGPDGNIYGTASQGGDGAGKPGIAFVYELHGLTAAVGVNRILLRWTAYGSRGSYDVFRATAGGQQGTNAFAATNATSFTDTAVNTGTTYYYTVAAVNSGRTNPQSAQVSATAAGAADTFRVVASGPLEAGQTCDFSVTAEDVAGNTAAGYGGTVTFSSTLGLAELPVNSALIDGVGLFKARFPECGTFRIKAADTVTSSISGGSNFVPVDPIAEPLFLQNSSTGQIMIWGMSGQDVISQTIMTAVPPAGFTVATAADFTGDGNYDVVMQNMGTRRIVYWYLNGTVKVPGGPFPISLPDGWRLASAADLSGTGHPWFILQDGHHITLWDLIGFTPTDGVNLPVAMESGVEVLGATDLNDDGKADIVISNGQGGTGGVLYMGGNAITTMSRFPAAYPQPYEVVAVRTLPAPDGPNLVWQDNSDLYENDLNTSLEPAGGGLVTLPVPAGWTVVGPR